jgi:hypothetical protein
MPKTAIAIGLTGLLLAAAAGTTEAAPFVPLPKADEAPTSQPTRPFLSRNSPVW